MATGRHERPARDKLVPPWCPLGVRDLGRREEGSPRLPGCVSSSVGTPLGSPSSHSRMMRSRGAIRGFTNGSTVSLTRTRLTRTIELSIPVVRHLCVNALGELGVTDECCSDISVALTEACTNVLVHSGPGDEYEVRVAIDGAACVIRIVDAGHGFDSENLAGGMAAAPTSME